MKCHRWIIFIDHPWKTEHEDVYTVHAQRDDNKWWKKQFSIMGEAPAEIFEYVYGKAYKELYEKIYCPCFVDKK